MEEELSEMKMERDSIEKVGVPQDNIMYPFMLIHGQDDWLSLS